MQETLGNENLEFERQWYLIIHGSPALTAHVSADDSVSRRSIISFGVKTQSLKSRFERPQTHSIASDECSSMQLPKQKGQENRIKLAKRSVNSRLTPDVGSSEN
jgi:hypothetical protein